MRGRPAPEDGGRVYRGDRGTDIKRMVFGALLKGVEEHVVIAILRDSQVRGRGVGV